MKCKECDKSKELGNTEECGLVICSKNDEWEMTPADGTCDQTPSEEPAKEDDGYIELEEKRAMVYLPENTVEANIDCCVYSDGKIIKVSRTLRMSEVQNAFRLAEDNYIEDNDIFTLTDFAKESIGIQGE